MNECSGPWKCNVNDIRNGERLVFVGNWFVISCFSLAISNMMRGESRIYIFAPDISCFWKYKGKSQG